MDHLEDQQGAPFAVDEYFRLSSHALVIEGGETNGAVMLAKLCIICSNQPDGPGRAFLTVPVTDESFLALSTLEGEESSQLEQKSSQFRNKRQDPSHPGS